MKSSLSDPTNVTFHDEDNQLIVKTEQDVEPILNENKALQNMEQNKKANFRKAASIPMVIWDAWMKEFKQKHGKEYAHCDRQTRERFIKAKLNDPDNAFLRTWQGTL